MSDYTKGNWSKIWDALYWEFIKDERSFFQKSRMAMMVSSMIKKLLR